MPFVDASIGSKLTRPTPDENRVPDRPPILLMKTIQLTNTQQGQPFHENRPDHRRRRLPRQHDLDDALASAAQRVEAAGKFSCRSFL